MEEAEQDHVAGDCPDEPEPVPTASLNHGGLFPQLPLRHRGSTDSISGLFWEPGRGLVAENITPWVDGGGSADLTALGSHMRKDLFHGCETARLQKLLIFTIKKQ